MRAPHQLVHSRARVRRRYALLPLEGFPTSRMPSCDGEVRVLCAPAIGANFAQYICDLPPGKGALYLPDQKVETFYYVLSGVARLEGTSRDLNVGSFGLVAPQDALSIAAAPNGPARLLILRKRFEPAGMK